MDQVRLQKLKRPQLQKLAQTHGIKANLKSAVIISQLLAKFPHRVPEVHKPDRSRQQASNISSARPGRGKKGLAPVEAPESASAAPRISRRSTRVAQRTQQPEVEEVPHGQERVLSASQDLIDLDIAVQETANTAEVNPRAENEGGSTDVTSQVLANAAEVDQHAEETPLNTLTPVQQKPTVNDAAHVNSHCKTIEEENTGEVNPRAENERGSADVTSQVLAQAAEIDQHAETEAFLNTVPLVQKKPSVNAAAHANPYSVAIEDVEDDSNDRANCNPLLQPGAHTLPETSIPANNVGEPDGPQLQYPSTPPTPQSPQLSSPSMTPTEIIHRGPHVPHVHGPNLKASFNGVQDWIQQQAAIGEQGLDGSGEGTSGPSGGRQKFVLGAIKGASWKGARETLRQLAGYGEECEQIRQEIVTISKILATTSKELRAANDKLEHMRECRLALERLYLPRFVINKNLRSGNIEPEEEVGSEVSPPSPASDSMDDRVTEYTVFPEWLDTGKDEVDSESDVSDQSEVDDDQLLPSRVDKGKGRAYYIDDSDEGHDHDYSRHSPSQQGVEPGRVTGKRKRYEYEDDGEEYDGDYEKDCEDHEEDYDEHERVKSHHTGCTIEYEQYPGQFLKEHHEKWELVYEGEGLRKWKRKERKDIRPNDAQHEAYGRGYGNGEDADEDTRPRKRFRVQHNY